MADPKTNISDEGAYRGATVTTLVADGSTDRNSEAVATRQGEAHDSWHRDEGSDPGPATPPTLTSLNPTSITVDDEPTLVTVTGTNFYGGSVVWADEEAQETNFVSATTLTYEAEADAEGSQTITVHNGAVVSNAVELTVTA